MLISCWYWFAACVSVMQVNDELLHRLTSGKNLSPRLMIRRSADTSVPLDYNSPPAEVENWLRKKGFSEPWVSHRKHFTAINNNTPAVTPHITDDGKKHIPRCIYNEVTAVVDVCAGLYSVCGFWTELSCSLWIKKSCALLFLKRALESTVSWPSREPW